LDEEDISDVASNLLASGANAPHKAAQIDKILGSLGNGLEKTYELVFNESLVNLSKSNYNTALE